jgi:hypothetical protein
MRHFTSGAHYGLTRKSKNSIRKQTFKSKRTHSIDWHQKTYHEISWDYPFNKNSQLNVLYSKFDMKTMIFKTTDKIKKRQKLPSCRMIQKQNMKFLWDYPFNLIVAAVPYTPIAMSSFHQVSLALAMDWPFSPVIVVTSQLMCVLYPSVSIINWNFNAVNRYSLIKCLKTLTVKKPTL